MQASGKDSEQIMRVIKTLRGKWTIQILCEMRRGPVRLGQLKRSIPMASKKALTSSLRWIEDARLIVRRDLSKSILHVEYELDERTKEALVALLTFLADWASFLPAHPTGSHWRLRSLHFAIFRRIIEDTLSSRTSCWSRLHEDFADKRYFEWMELIRSAMHLTNECPLRP